MTSRPPAPREEFARNGMILSREGEPARGAPEAPRTSVHLRTLRRSVFTGVALTGLFGGTIGLWAATSTLSGAVMAPGQFVVDTNVKKVQHPTGGIVGELRVREGDRVNEGDLLIRLDETITRANLQVVTKQLDELAARQARLEAERDGRTSMPLPQEFTGRGHDPAIAKLMDSERSLFGARAAAREGQKSQLRNRIAQLQDEIVGLRAQQAAKTRESTIIVDELKGVRELFAKNLVQISRVSALEREAASLEGQRGQLIAAVAQAEGKIAEIALQIIQIDEQMRADVLKELREIQGRMAELMERRVAAEDQLKRIDVRAPSSGFVHQLAVHTVGGVITPAEPAMLIVPMNEAINLEAKVMPQDIDQLTIGQPAIVRVHASNQRTTPEINGTVSRMSADVTREQQTGLTYYTIRVTLPPEEVQRLGGIRLVAGMQADVFIQTTDRTPLEYFLKPLQDQIARAFRES